MGTPCRKLKTTKTTLILKENVGRKTLFYAAFALLAKKLLITALKYASTVGIWIMNYFGIWMTDCWIVQTCPIIVITYLVKKYTHSVLH